MKRDTTPGISGNGLVELWRSHCHAVRNLSSESRLKRLESENQDRPLAIGGKRTDWEFRTDVRIDRLGCNRKPVILLGASAPRGALPSSKN
jgi:hypothetical protein